MLRSMVLGLGLANVFIGILAGRSRLAVGLEVKSKTSGNKQTLFCQMIPICVWWLNLIFFLFSKNVVRGFLFVDSLSVFAESKDQPVGKFRPTFTLFIFNFINKLRLFRLCSCNLNRMIWTSIGLLPIMKYMGDYLMAKGQSEEQLCPHYPHGTDSFDCFYKFSSKNNFSFPVLELIRIATRRGLLSNHETNCPVRIPATQTFVASLRISGTTILSTSAS